MKKALGILLALTLALSLAVTALADESTPPTGDNVIKMTDKYGPGDEHYKGDIYLEFSEITYKEQQQQRSEDGDYLDTSSMYIQVPVGATVTAYWFVDGKQQDISTALIKTTDHKTTPDGIGFAARDVVTDDEGNMYYGYVYPEVTVNAGGSATFTFTDSCDEDYYFYLNYPEWLGWEADPDVYVYAAGSSQSDAGDTGAATENTTPPTGDNVVKLTDAYESSDAYYNGDLYLDFFAISNKTTEQVDEWGDIYNLLHIYIPTGSTVTVYWFADGKQQNFNEVIGDYYTSDTLAINWTSISDGEDFAPEITDNGDGSTTFTFNHPGTYRLDKNHGWAFDFSGIFIDVSDSVAPSQPSLPPPATQPRPLPARVTPPLPPLPAPQLPLPEPAAPTSPAAPTQLPRATR